MADLQSPSADWPLATPWARTRRQKRRGEGRLPHWGADRFLTGKSHRRKLHCVQASGAKRCMPPKALSRFAERGAQVGGEAVTDERVGLFTPDKDRCTADGMIGPEGRVGGV